LCQRHTYQSLPANAKKQKGGNDDFQPCGLQDRLFAAINLLVVGADNFLNFPRHIEKAGFI
jgi:hypothetical protein